MKSTSGHWTMTITITITSSFTLFSVTIASHISRAILHYLFRKKTESFDWTNKWKKIQCPIVFHPCLYQLKQIYGRTQELFMERFVFGHFHQNIRMPMNTNWLDKIIYCPFFHLLLLHLLLLHRARVWVCDISCDGYACARDGLTRVCPRQKGNLPVKAPKKKRLRVSSIRWQGTWDAPLSFD